MGLHFEGAKGILAARFQTEITNKVFDFCSLVLEEFLAQIGAGLWMVDFKNGLGFVGCVSERMDYFHILLRKGRNRSKPYISPSIGSLQWLSQAGNPPGKGLGRRLMAKGSAIPE